MQKETKANLKTGHETVFLQEAVEALVVEADGIIVDATVGGAGHFALLEAKLNTSGTLIGIDADREALQRAEAVQRNDGPRVILAEDNFRNLNHILDSVGIDRIDGSLFDLGWSGYQLEANRGFTFKKEEPLLMTYGARERGKTAADFVNSATEEELADILYTYGEERFSRGIARGIVDARAKERILSTTALVSAVMASTPEWYHHKRIHPATKTFQALRIAVNDELGAVREGLSTAIARTNPGGRVAVITFHSIEDRIVKNLFRDAATAGSGIVLTKKPMVPSTEEVARNPRARSAKLRVFEVASVPATTASAYAPLSYAG